jgi:hypothetical protein
MRRCEEKKTVGEAKQEEKCRLAININFLINIRCHAAKSQTITVRGRGFFFAVDEKKIPFLIHRRLADFSHLFSFHFMLRFL